MWSNGRGRGGKTGPVPKYYVHKCDMRWKGKKNARISWTYRLWDVQELARTSHRNWRSTDSPKYSVYGSPLLQKVEKLKWDHTPMGRHPWKDT